MDLAAVGIAGAFGGLGGLSLSLVALRFRHYRNNRLLQKVALEIIGGTIVGIGLGSGIATSQFGPGISFALGVSWSGTVQYLRKRVTAIVGKAIDLGDAGGESSDP